MPVHVVRFSCVCGYTCEIDRGRILSIEYPNDWGKVELDSWAASERGNLYEIEELCPSCVQKLRDILQDFVKKATLR